MTKAEARAEYLKKRKSLDDAERDELNRKILERFLASGYLDNASSIHVFLSMERTNEPDTWKLIEKIRSNHRLIIPKINESGTLDHFYFEGIHQLKPNSLGILEPVDGVRANVDEIDLVLVPLVAFDKPGNRVGYGKGYYDKFLKTCRVDCIKAGLSFFPPAEKFSDVEAHDVPLDVCFTPTWTYKF